VAEGGVEAIRRGVRGGQKGGAVMTTQAWAYVDGNGVEGS
jgi:hypothetical protein